MIHRVSYILSKPAVTTLRNNAGLKIDVLENGELLGIHYESASHGFLINQILGSPLGGKLGHLHLRIEKNKGAALPLDGSRARVRVGAGSDRLTWEGETETITHRTTLWLDPTRPLFFWRIDLQNHGPAALQCDAIFLQMLGLGEHGFVMGNEAFASQYIDHHIATHPRIGPVIMSHQNLPQAGKHPWVMHGCLEGAASFATDMRQVAGPSHRNANGLELPFGSSLPGARLQHECGCAALQTKPAMIAPAGQHSWTFFCYLKPDHPGASGAADMEVIDEIIQANRAYRAAVPETHVPGRSLFDDALSAPGQWLQRADIERLYPERILEEHHEGRLLSFFVPSASCDRHVVMAEKEVLVGRRHGELLKSGSSMLPDEETMCLTVWMHGIFGAQLTIGNTSFHKLLSVSRDPYNISRSSGLRIFFEADGIWRLLTTPSAFDMGINACNWIYKFPHRTIVVSVTLSGNDAAAQWHLSVEGEPCRFAIVAQIVLGEREYEHRGAITIDKRRKRIAFYPAKDEPWGGIYPDASLHLVTSAADDVEAIGTNELVQTASVGSSHDFVSLRTKAVGQFVFSIVGSLKDRARAESLAEKFSDAISRDEGRESSIRYWNHLTRNLCIIGPERTSDMESMNSIIPWFVHDAMFHLTVPHGLEQYSGAAWGTRDVAQGPVELLLALEHDAPVRDILRILFAQQYPERGDWPQWFMLAPYSSVQASDAHGDVIVWPLKALCDYIEATGDVGFLQEQVPWRNETSFASTQETSTIIQHVERLLATVQERFIPGTHLLEYGEGDWNDSLQPVDPAWRKRMSSSWTIALLYQQLVRYAQIMSRIDLHDEARRWNILAAAVQVDFNRFLVRDNVVMGYGLFNRHGEPPEPILHPADARTGVSYSLLPMVQAILAGLFTHEQTQHHLALIRKHLKFPDGVRLMDKPIRYEGGVETIFRRAESAAFFGREIGLMYVHAHLRYAEALAMTGDAEGMWEAMLRVNPICVRQHVPNASPRQRNAYFSSSDAAYADRIQASVEWQRARDGTIDVDGGWRIYSSGSGIFLNLLIRHALGFQRRFGEKIRAPCLPQALGNVTLVWDPADRCAIGARQP